MRKGRIILAVISALICSILLCSCDILDELVQTRTVSYKENNTYELAVHFLDIGQGDSIFIELPDNHTMLIDSGENYHGEGIIEYIEDYGYSRIDYLVATHPHTDHIGSMPYIVRNFDIGEVYMPKVSATTAAYENLLKAISNKNLKIKSTKAGMSIIDTDTLSIDVLGPVKIDQSNLNNCSIVMKVTYGTTSFLFTGDAEKEELNSIKGDISADVLKVGHHGSRTSTTKAILERINPEIAVISAGKNNDYGHPHTNVMKLLKNAECQIYRTDQDATVTITSDGEKLEVSTGGKSIKKAK